jgi:hypothetical protein
MKTLIETNSETDERYQKYKRVIYEKTLEISKLKQRLKNADLTITNLQESREGSPEKR